MAMAMAAAGSGRSTPPPLGNDDGALLAAAAAGVVRSALLARFQADYRRLLAAREDAADVLSESSSALQHLLLSLQLILAHGLRSRASRWFEASPTVWSAIEAIARLPERERALVTEAVQSVASVQAMMGGRGPLEKARVWLLKALMEKHLAVSLRVLSTCDALLAELYEPVAMVRLDDFAVVLGLLDGLEGLEYAFDLKAAGRASAGATSVCGLSPDDVASYLAAAVALPYTPPADGVAASAAPATPAPSDRDGDAEMVAGLNRHTKFLRGRLGRTIELKFTPDLKFVHDESFDEAQRMSRLFEDPRVAQDLTPQPPSDSWKDED